MVYSFPFLLLLPVHGFLAALVVAASAIGFE